MGEAGRFAPVRAFVFARFKPETRSTRAAHRAWRMAFWFSCGVWRFMHRFLVDQAPPYGYSFLYSPMTCAFVFWLSRVSATVEQNLCTNPNLPQDQKETPSESLPADLLGAEARCRQLAPRQASTKTGARSQQNTATSGRKQCSSQARAQKAPRRDSPSGRQCSCALRFRTPPAP